MNKKYKFAYITEVDISIDNGPGINERGFVNELLNSYDTDVLCVLPYPAFPEIYYDERIEYVFNHKKFNPFFYVIYNVVLFFKMAKLCKKNTFNAVIFRLGVIPFIPFLVHYFFKMPVMLKTLAGYTMFSNIAGGKYSLIAKIAFPFYKYIINRALFADTVSLPYIEWLNEKFGISKERMELIPNGTNIEMFIPQEKKLYRDEFGVDKFDYIIGYVGALDTIRHIDLLIKALKKIQTNMKVGLVLVGKGKDQKLLEILADELDLREKIVFTGFVPFSEIPKIMSTFDIAVDITKVPMKINGKTIDASYSQKIPQYLSCGRPVVAWEVDDNKFLEEEDIGRLVKNCKDVTDGELANAIQYLLNLDDDERSKMEIKSRRYAESYLSIQSLTKKRISIWNSSVK